MLTLIADPKGLWYLNRASGGVLLVVWTAAIVLGQLAAVRSARATLPRFAWLELHRNLVVVGVFVLVVHVATAVLDDYVDIGVADVVLPFRTHYQPFWLGLGALAADLAIVIVVTTTLRHRIPRVWAVVHRAAYALWPLAVGHGVGIGTDASTVPLSVGSVAVVAAAGGARLLLVARERNREHRWAP